MRRVLACDLGGSSFRAALVDATGQLLHLRTVPLAGGVDAQGVAEADPARWWAALTQTLDAIAAASGALFDTVEAMAISGFTRTQVFLDHHGIPLREAMTWRDTRAEATLPALRALLPPDHPETPAVNSFHPLARLHWLARTEPATHARLAHVIEPKDYLNFRLTGRLATDEIAGARLIAASTAAPGSPSLLDAAGLSKDVLPTILAPTEMVGHVTPGQHGALGRLAGRPVLAMATDTWASVLGLGALRPGFAYNLSGTTEVLGVLSPHAAKAEGLVTIDWGQGLSQIGGPSQNGADTLAWLVSLIGQSDVTGLDALLSLPRDKEPALFLPYLQGERTPYWDPTLRGAFIGLNRRHGPGDLAHAVLEGVAFHNRIVLERAEAALGQQVAEIRFGGGGAASARWCQIKANVTGRPVVVAGTAEPGLLGAAIVAFTALGLVADLAAGQARLVQPGARFTPQPDAVARYNALFSWFRAAEAAIAPISRGLTMV